MTYRISWRAVLTAALVLVAGYLISTSAEASGSKTKPAVEAQAFSNSGAEASANQTATAELSAPQNLSSDTDVRMVGFSGGAVQPLPVYGCPLYLPGDGHNRSWGVWGISTSGVYERNDECWVAMEAERSIKLMEAEARLLEAQNEQARLREAEAVAACAEGRDRVETAWQECQAK